MDAALISAVYLMQDWVKRLIEDYEDEVQGSNVCVLKLVKEECRKAVWSICEELGLKYQGLPGQACRLFERYLRNHMQDILRAGGIDTYEEWVDQKRSLASQLPLFMASCAQLAGKMNNMSEQINARHVRTCLIGKGVVFSEEDIIRSEFQVFSTLGFRMPLWTSLDIAQMLAVEVGLKPPTMRGITLIINLAEYRRCAIAASVRNVASSTNNSPFNPSSLTTLHLSAGVVAVSAGHLINPSLDLSPHLAALTRAPAVYIRCVHDVIVADFIDNVTNITHTRKRKRRK